MTKFSFFWQTLCCLLIVAFGASTRLQAQTQPAQDAQQLFDKGLELSRDKEYSEAIEKFSAAIVKQGNFADAYYERARAYAAINETEEAFRDLEIMITLAPSAKAYYQKGIISLKVGYNNEAVENLSTAISLDSTYALAYYYRASIYFATNRLKRSLADYTKCIELTPDYPDAYNDRASVYRQQEKYDLAIVDYTKAIALNDSCDFYYTNRGGTYRLQKEYDKALEDYNKALSFGAKDKAMILNNKGLAEQENGYPNNALQSFLEAQTADSAYYYAYNNAGNLYYLQKNYTEALAQYNKAIELKASFGTAYLNRGMVKEMLHDDDGACEDWAKASKLDVEAANGYISKQCK
ncbi:hypothetical protein AGMMS4956_05470 [Bacteroidia bacterium]|nr:hypothetical protein AGMMS4956_05470 [Bacteroidia bacterium]